MSWSEWIEQFESRLLECDFLALTGHVCPGCGLQRAMLLLLRGEFLESFTLFPALIPMLFTIGFLPIQLKLKFDRGGLVLMWGFISTITLMLTKYIFVLL
jgi:hypothetical protein